MKTNIIRNAIIFAVVSCCITNGTAQGFINLNFESASVPDVPTNQQGAFVSVASGMPGWTAAYGGTPGQIGHNNFSAGGAFVCIEGPQWSSMQILQGNYTAYIVGAQFSGTTSAYIAQTGQIPADSMSVQFYIDQSGFDNFQVTFGGQAIPIEQLGTGPNYYRMGGDISSFAGQTGELRFTALPNTGGLLDNIIFSTSPVPEPGSLALLTAGAILLGLRRWRNPLR